MLPIVFSLHVVLVYMQMHTKWLLSWLCTITKSYPFLLITWSFHWVVFSIKSHCLRVNRMRTMTKLSTFPIWRIRKTEATAGGALIANTDNWIIRYLDSMAIQGMLLYFDTHNVHTNPLLEINNNNSVSSWTLSEYPIDYKKLRRRWNRLHGARMLCEAPPTSSFNTRQKIRSGNRSVNLKLSVQVSYASPSSDHNYWICFQNLNK